MEDWTNPQNEMFKKVFSSIQEKTNAVFRSDALAMLKLNDENFINLWNQTTEIYGEAEDVDLCNQRAIHLKLI
jgi:hypothetical protein